ncbi:MAG TPA: FtsX-like permease family protein, partial [Gemmatimonadaceae bacterium]|nr:FtsX-like permease family protein [Gemmatimonadaceae bacterium]
MIIPRPTPWRHLARLAWRESRTARRRLFLYMSSISLGVAALVAIDSFAANITRSVRDQSRQLLGGDLLLSARAPVAPAADSLLDSLAASGSAQMARVTTFFSMGVVPRTGRTRLVQVRSVRGPYPLYGRVVTQPADRWGALQSGPNVFVDPAVLVSLDARVGDTLTLGFGRFVIAGTLVSVPGDAGMAAVMAPRVFIPARYVAETGLLTLGSRAEVEVMVRTPDDVEPAKWLQPVRTRLERGRVRARTVAQNEASMTQGIEELSDFLGIVGLIALLLGGVGVASGVNAFVTRKIDTVAVLRCLGATSGQVLGIYVLQAAAMGLLGAALGAALGVAVQFALPTAVNDFLPVDVSVRLEPGAITAGLLVGVWVAMVFAMRPLLALRTVSPLQALRREAGAAVGIGAWRDLPLLLVNLALAGSVVLLAATRAETMKDAFVLSAGIAVVLLVLWASAGALSWAARRLMRAGWPYVVRQGVANLYRPANQTRSVVLSLGFGAFLITTLYQVQASLLHQFASAAEDARANIIMIDVQEDQAPGIDSIVRALGHPVVQVTPIVIMRIKSINGWDMAAMTNRSNPPDGVVREGWALRREYRSTYRTGLQPSSESVVAGTWFDSTRVSAADTLFEMSFEREVARSLGVKLGDVVVWDVQGVPVRARVTSLREVNWRRFEPNFFAVFPPAALEAAPKQFVVLARARGADAIGTLQRQVVDRYPNVSSIDLTLVLETIEAILARVRVAVRFMAIFSLAMGIPVLFSAVAATRRDRVREGVLLKTLGATRAQIGRIMLAEYALLGVLGSLTGMVLSFGDAWGLTHYLFKSQ